MTKIACQTPKEHCFAPLVDVNNNLVGQGRPRKLHSTSEEAFKCYVAYLLRTGHVRVGGREFKRPGGGIVVVTKPSRYGAVFRTGKKPQGSGGKRFQPADWQRKSSHHGVIIG